MSRRAPAPPPAPLRPPPPLWLTDGSGARAGNMKKFANKGRGASSNSGSGEVAGGAGGGAGGGDASGRDSKPGVPEITAQGCKEAYAKILPSFADIPNSQKQHLFVEKLHLCAYTFDFTDQTQNVREKEIKRQTLLELVDYVNTGSGKFTEAVSSDIVFMLQHNLFRALPPSEGDGADAEDEEPTLEPAWPHLQVVYEFLLRFIVSNETEARTAKKYVDQTFVLKLLELFDSEDPRERDYLKTILHRIYGKFMAHRPHIRKAINNIFFIFIYETERHNGIAELLEILGSIINGFALPLKEEHRRFLKKALVPLHKPKCLALYHQPLSYCITQFVEKDPRLAEEVISGMLKYWPVTNSQKEVLFLGELEEILELIQGVEFEKIMVPLFKVLAKCLCSSHFQVSERALFLWNNEYIVSLVAKNRDRVLPLIIGALEVNEDHWNAAVHGLTCNVRKLFMQMDPGLWQACKANYDQEVVELEKHRAEAKGKWEQIEAMAKSKTNGA